MRLLRGSPEGPGSARAVGPGPGHPAVVRAHPAPGPGGGGPTGESAGDPLASLVTGTQLGEGILCPVSGFLTEPARQLQPDTPGQLVCSP